MRTNHLTVDKAAEKREGSIAVIAAFTLAVLMGFSALVVDVGNIYRVRDELQNAADAAALAGAQELSRDDTLNSPPWPSAETAAVTDAPPNRANGIALTSNDYEAHSGFWNLDDRAAGLQEVQPTGSRVFRAVEVTVTKTIPHWFAPIFGKNASQLTGKATAISAYPGVAKPGAVLPLVINQSLADRMQDHNTPETNVLITDGNHTDGIEGSRWSTFFNTNNGDKYTKDLLEGTELSPTLQIGDSIQINPGVRAVDYGYIQDYWLNKDVVLPVVQTLDGNSTQPIVGFIGFHIVAAKKNGNPKNIQGYFVSGLYRANVTNLGPNYGLYSPPRLVQ